MFATQIEFDNVYKFKYGKNPTNRLILAIDFQEGNKILCWDFIAGNYRSFNLGNIVGCVDVTDHVVRTEDLTKSFSSCITHIHNNILYAVKV